MAKEERVIITSQDRDIRLDFYLSHHHPIGLSRSFIQKLIEEGKITVNGRKVKPSYKLKIQDEIKVFIPPPKQTEILPEKIPLDIVYEDEDLIVLNKPQGMVVHPGAGHYSGTLVNALLFHCHNLSEIGGKLRPGIVHRLDKDTSGLLLVAKNDFTHQHLSNQIRKREIKREYLALIVGELKPAEGIIKTYYGRDKYNRKKMKVIRIKRPMLSRTGREDNGMTTKVKEAITLYKTEKRYSDFTLLKIKILTGRTHQIRVHLSYLGHPVVGDKIYGRKKFNPPYEFLNALPGQLLHAYTIGFMHPRKGEYMEFEVPLNPVMKETILYLSSLVYPVR